MSSSIDNSPYIDPNLLRILIVLAKLGALKEFELIKTSLLAEILVVSEHSASRWLDELSPKYLGKQHTVNGLKLKLTEEGQKVLRVAFLDLLYIFHGIPQIRGVVADGLGEGKYYIALDGYTKQFEQYLGYRPYKGTLNLQLSTSDDIEAFQQLLKSPAHLIHGFEHEGRTVGEVLLWRCHLLGMDNKSLDGAVIHPVRTHHNPRSIIEIIAEINLREYFSLRTGDTLIVKLALD